MGCARLRKSLYMPALVAVRYNPIMKGLCDRLQAKGKPMVNGVGLDLIV
ncbi:MAG: hypothetical protein COB26_08550 [Piscirickettsiaceae bacterium]|nr:MAG: hypothetical protein COB26_08550 [Piscirickettsiaceae bacterium]